MLRFASIFLLAFFVFPNVGFSQNPVRDGQVEVALVPEVESIAPSEPFVVAVVLKMDEDWHTYWRNSGDSGLPTKITWKLPPGFSASEPQWPVPEAIEYGGIMSYGYHGEAWLLVTITPPAEFPDSVTVGADVDWLMCKESCVPGEASLSISLPRGDGAADMQNAQAFLKARDALPIDASLVGGEFVFSEDSDGNILLSFQLESPVSSAYFFAHDAEWVDIDAAQEFSAGKINSLKIKKSRYAKDQPNDSSGVLLLNADATDGSRAALLIRAEKEGMAVPALETTFLAALLLAFVGGLILNVMPCVLPVISLKIFDFMKQAHGDPKKIFAHGLSYSGGVLVSFNIFLVAILALRATGDRVGWAFQMQDPVLVLLLGCLLVVVTAALFGAIELGSGLAAAGARAAQGKSGVGGSFFTGVLASVLATPCTAPYMAAALGYALTAPLVETVAVFQMLAIGMALPYLLLSLFPNLLKFLPKPGPWMESFKQFTGFLMLGALLWITWVFASLVDHEQLIPYFVLLGVVALVTWIVGKFAGPEAAAPRKMKAWGTALALLLVTIFFMREGLASLREPLAADSGTTSVSFSENVTAREGRLPWQNWSPETLQEARNTGRPVFVDFTATWCLICKANEASSLNVPQTIELFERYDIIPLKADWTRRPAAMSEAIESYGRAGVPIYVLYTHPGAAPILLPETLTVDTVRKAIVSALGER